MSSSLAYRMDSDDEVRIRPVGPGPSTASEPEEPGAPAWLARTVRAIHELRLLGPNWDTRGASALDETAMLLALELLHGAASHDTPPPDVVPTVVGGIQLEWHRSRMDIELDVSPDLRAGLYWLDRESGREWEGPLTLRRPRELAEVIEELTARTVRARPHGAR